MGVPSSAGARAKGQEKAPAALRGVRLVEKLKEAGHKVIDYGDAESSHFILDLDDPKAQNKFAVAKVCRLVAEKVKRALDNGFNPIILGGDCSSLERFDLRRGSTALKLFAQSDRFLGMEVTEFNADKDREGRLTAKLAELIAFAME